MASIGRLVKKRDSAVDAKDAEMAARAARKSEEKFEREEKAAAAAKLEAEANDKPHNVFSSGVFRMLDDEYVDKEDDSSPVVQRRSSDGKPEAYPMGSTGGGVMGQKSKAPAKVSTGWAPTGGFGEQSNNPKDVIARALQNAAISDATEEPRTVGDVSGMGAALSLLGEQLAAERARTARAEERNAVLEAQLAKVTQDLLDVQAKAVERLTRENDRWLALKGHA